MQRQPSNSGLQTIEQHAIVLTAVADEAVASFLSLCVAEFQLMLSPYVRVIKCCCFSPLLISRPRACLVFALIMDSILSAMKTVCAEKVHDPASLAVKVRWYLFCGEAICVVTVIS